MDTRNDKLLPYELHQLDRVCTTQPCTTEDLDHYFNVKNVGFYRRYLENPIASMIIAAKDLNSQVLVNYFYHKTLIDNVNIDDITPDMIRVESLSLYNPIDAIIPYSYMNQPQYLDDTLVGFISKLFLGIFPNGFPIMNILNIITHHKIGSVILLQNILDYAQQHYLLDDILQDINEYEERHRTPNGDPINRYSTATHTFNDIIDRYINIHLVPNNSLPPEYALYTKSARLYSHLYMLNNLIVDLPNY